MRPFTYFPLLFSPKRLRRMNLLKRLRKCSFICPPPITDYYFIVCQLLCELQWRVITQRIHDVPVITLTLTGKIRGVHDLQKTELISWKSTLLRCHQNTTVCYKRAGKIQFTWSRIRSTHSRKICLHAATTNEVINDLRGRCCVIEGNQCTLPLIQSNACGFYLKSYRPNNND